MDRRDNVALLSVFCQHATMRVEQPGRAPGMLRGHDELNRLTTIIARWPRTLHLLSQGVYEIESHNAEGEIYCTAHHFSESINGRGMDHVMYIRYLDRYELGADNRWLIGHRTVKVEAAEDRSVLLG